MIYIKNIIKNQELNINNMIKTTIFDNLTDTQINNICNLIERNIKINFGILTFIFQNGRIYDIKKETNYRRIKKK